MITVIGSYKGGSGKSTVTFNLALWLLNVGKSVVAHDLDPQATLSDAAGVRREEHFLPDLNVTEQYPEPSEAEEVLVDIGTADMKAMKHALTVADRILLPVGPSQADVWSAQRFLYLISSLKRHKPLDVMAFINRADTHVSVRESDDTAAVLKALPGVNVLRPRLGLRTAYRRSFSEGLAVFELEPEGKAAFEFNKLAKTVYPGLVK